MRRKERRVFDNEESFFPLSKVWLRLSPFSKQNHSTTRIENTPENVQWGIIMGADMILVCLAIPEGKDLENAKKLMLEKINELSKADLGDIAQYKEAIYGIIPEDEKDVKKVLEDAKKEFAEVVETTLERLHYRDVTYMTHKGDTLYLTGGMSWGDAPTESFEWFDKFGNLPPSVSRILFEV